MYKNYIPGGALGKIEVLLTNFNFVNIAYYFVTVHTHAKHKNKRTISTCDVIYF